MNVWVNRFIDEIILSLELTYKAKGLLDAGEHRPLRLRLLGMYSDKHIRTGSILGAPFICLGFLGAIFFLSNVYVSFAVAGFGFIAATLVTYGFSAVSRHRDRTGQ